MDIASFCNTMDTAANVKLTAAALTIEMEMKEIMDTYVKDYTVQLQSTLEDLKQIM